MAKAKPVTPPYPEADADGSDVVSVLKSLANTLVRDGVAPPRVVPVVEQLIACYESDYTEVAENDDYEDIPNDE